MRKYSFTSWWAMVVVTLYINSTGYAQKIGSTFGGSKEDQGICIRKTSDGNLLLIGFSSSDATRADIYIVKTTMKGVPIWEQKFGGPGDDYGWDMQETENGKNYLITGFSSSYGAADTDVVLLKITRDGEQRWIKNIPTPDEDDRAVSMEKTQDGHFILIGQSKDRKTKNYNGLVTKVDGDGNLIWRKVFGDDSYDRLFYGKETGNRDILIAGITRKDSLAENVGWLLLLTKDGVQKESRTMSSIRNTTTHGVLKVSDNEFRIIGYAQTDTAVNQRSIYLAAVDSHAKIIWEKTTTEPANDSHGISGTLTSSDAIIVTGYSRPVGGGKWDGVLYKFDRTGKQLWRKQFGSPDTEMPYTIISLSATRFVLTGRTDNNSHGLNDMWLVFLDEKGNVL